MITWKTHISGPQTQLPAHVLCEPPLFPQHLCFLHCAPCSGFQGNTFVRLKQCRSPFYSASEREKKTAPCDVKTSAGLLCFQWLFGKISPEFCFGRCHFQNKQPPPRNMSNAFTCLSGSSSSFRSGGPKAVTVRTKQRLSEKWSCQFLHLRPAASVETRSLYCNAVCCNGGYSKVWVA